MTAPNELSNTLRFFCPACRAELAVPVAMAGIEGPCPSCYQTIRAPLTTPVPVSTAWNSLPEPQAEASWPMTAPMFPPVREEPLRPLAPALYSRPEMQASVPPGPQERSFKAKRAIPPAEEPLDDTWKDRRRDQHRSSRRVRRAERVAHSFLESRSFRVVRVGLILASGAMLAFLFNYLENHQWRLPGVVPSVAADKPDASSPGKVRSAPGDANEIVADDDMELPPASGNIPAPPRNGGKPVVSGAPR